MRILITGSRECTNLRLVRGAIQFAAGPPGDYSNAVVTQGGARGADTLAATAARELGIPTQQVDADWDQYGKRAGFIRNKKMIDQGQDICLAFFKEGAGNRGTTHCATEAEKAGIFVLRFTEKQGD